MAGQGGQEIFLFEVGGNDDGDASGDKSASVYTSLLRKRKILK